MKDVLDDLSFERIRGLLNRHAGIELNPSKRQMAINRLSKPMRSLGFHTIADYLKLVETDQAQRQAFINAMTTNVTSFFREPHHFPLLISELNDRPEPVTLWSAGCSTGQEPYSLAIALCEAFPGRFDTSPSPSILATDIDTQVLQHARNGLYTAAEVQMLGEPLRQKYFSHTDADLFQARPLIRQMIEFRAHNLAAPVASPAPAALNTGCVHVSGAAGT